MNKKRLCVLITCVINYPLLAVADPIEVITVTGDNVKLLEKNLAAEQVASPDISSWLESIPGAHVNRNGPLTGIAQYRGMYGDRVAASINGQTIIGAGPNAMDTPLSYSPAIITESLSVYRGIAPVEAGIETLGGAVQVKTKKAELSQTPSSIINGKLVTSYASGNDAGRGAGYINIANDNVAVLAYVDSKSASDSDAADSGQIEPTEYHKNQIGLNVTLKQDSAVYGVSYDYTDTHDSGTASLPMDIIYIYSNRYAINADYDLSHGQLSLQLGYHDADHVMDNFSMRSNDDLSNFRVNTTTSDNYDFLAKWQGDAWSLGIDGYRAVHDAVIKNPNNEMFRVVNFNDVIDIRTGIFAQWQKQFEQTKLQTGIRINHIMADADDVSHHMSGKNQAIANLMSEFNDADKDISDTNFDIVLHVNHKVSDETNLSVSFARKERAPSYQERYLWIPMEATGGLGDGNTYLGGIDLDSEVAYQSNFGINYQQNKLSMMADVYYQHIDDYIQGVPSENNEAKMLAKMMSNNDNLLQFDNVEAKLYGLDSYAHYQLDEQLSMSFLMSYVRGERDDINDYLYRISPLKGKFKLSYQTDVLDTGISITGIAKQNKVSDTNQEEKTSGYAVIDAYFDYYFSNNVVVKSGVKNLLDRVYQNHLAGYNRVKDTATPIMQRLPSTGRSFHMELNYSF